MTLWITFQGQDDPKSSQLYQKYILHPRISYIRGITHVVKLKNKQSDIFIMSDGGHFGFDDSRIVAMIMEKHLIDFSCLGSN